MKIVLDKISDFLLLKIPASERIEFRKQIQRKNNIWIELYVLISFIQATVDSYKFSLWATFFPIFVFCFIVCFLSFLYLRKYYVYKFLIVIVLTTFSFMYQMEGFSSKLNNLPAYIDIGILALYKDLWVLSFYFIIVIIRFSVVYLLQGQIITFFPGYDFSFFTINENTIGMEIRFFFYMYLTMIVLSLVQRHSTFRTLQKSRIIEDQLLKLEEIQKNQALANKQLTENSIKLKETADELFLFSQVVKKTQNSVLITNAKKEIIWVNEAFIKNTGYALNEIIGKNPGTFLQGKDSNFETILKMRENLNENKTVDVEILNYTKSGKKIWFRLLIKPLFDHKLNLTHFVSVQIDVGINKLQEIELQNLNEEVIRQKEQIIEQQKIINESFQSRISHYESKLISLFESTKNAIWQIDTDFNLLNYNRSFGNLVENIFETKIDGNSNFKLISPQTNQDIFNELINASEKSLQNTYQIFTFSFAKQNLIIEFSFNPIIVDKIVTGVSIFGNDITLQTQNEEVLKQKADSLKESNKELDTFIYKTNHDLKAPIATAKGILNLAAIEKYDNIYIKHLEQCVIKLDHSLDVFLQLSQIISTVVKVSKFNLLELFTNGNYDKMESFDLIIDQSMDKYIISSKPLLASVIEYIILNAISFKKEDEKAKVEIRLIEDNENYHILIKDYGLGIEPNIAEYVFDMFFKSRSYANNLGLGLYYAKKIMTKLKGNITFESLPLPFTIFHLTFPKEF